VLAKYAPAAAIIMGLFIVHLYWTVKSWPLPGDQLIHVTTFLTMPDAAWVLVDLFGTAVAGGAFVVPLYAFLTTTVAKSETARTVAANNIINSGAMVLAAGVLFVMVQAGISIADTLLIVAVSSLGSAWLAWKLHLACD
jgi:hypothetical protein